MNKVLVMCGPTATGKTNFALEIAKELDGELVSADSRQVYKEINIINGKDLPANIKYQISNIQWKDRYLQYYLIQDIKVWLYDIVLPNEEFNVSFWHECALKMISDIHSRGKLPIIVGGTGLYIKSLTENIETIDIPINKSLRKQLEVQTTEELFNLLQSLDSSRATQLNDSDKNNPRRLIRAIEVAKNTDRRKSKNNPYLDILEIGLTNEKNQLFINIEKRVDARIASGAQAEYNYLREKYDLNLPSMKMPGIADWESWKLREQQYARRQLVWFQKFPAIKWVNQSNSMWKEEAKNLIKNWYLRYN